MPPTGGSSIGVWRGSRLVAHVPVMLDKQSHRDECSVTLAEVGHIDRMPPARLLNEIVTNNVITSILIIEKILMWRRRRFLSLSPAVRRWPTLASLRFPRMNVFK